jgi:2-dehydro-3-deoxyphosphogluconate aldolase / (4S)-4-hydroxy-2-oxoglutarate aldolase
MTKNEKLKLIRDTGIIAIIRAQRSDQLIAAADAICQGGVRVVEVTMTTPGALAVITQAANKFGDEILFGAGTVLDAETARVAILAGAGFIVSPNIDLDNIALCNRYNVPIIPGGYTPTELLSARQAGADMIKLFPADVGGPKLVRALLAPFPQLELVPTGGVDLDNAHEFIRAGAAALGVGSSLISQAVLDSSDMSELTRRAAAFVEAVKVGRSQRK